VSPRRERYAELAGAGVNQRDIAAALGVTKSAVSKALSRAGIGTPRMTPSNSRKPTGTLLNEWREKLATGNATRADMANHFGVTLSTTHRWVGAVGAKPGPAKGSSKPAVEYIAKPVGNAEQRSLQRRQREALKRAALLGEISGGQR
jgi:transposase